jgi:mRNA-degrading endonuclease RelE of RelBE toxin-antitoxin system
LPYLVVIANPARKELKKLSKQVQVQIVGVLEGLKAAPRSVNAEKLQANPTFLRLRSGNYRVIYAIDDVRQLCVVVVIRDRKNAFKGMGLLDEKLERALAVMGDQILEQAAQISSAM